MNLPDLGGNPVYNNSPFAISIDGTSWFAPGPDVELAWDAVVYVRFALKNFGNEAAENVQYTFKINDNFIFNEEPIGTIPENSYGVLGLGGYQLFNPGVNQLSLVLDPRRTVNESNEDNNTYTCTVRLGSADPDFRFYTGSSVPQSGTISTDNGNTWSTANTVESEESFHFRFYYTNYGPEAFEDVPVWIKINDVKLPFTTNLGNVRSYNYLTRSFCFDPGEYTITVMLDPENTIQETDESNNSYTYTLTVEGNQDWLMKTRWGAGERLLGTDITLNAYAPLDPVSGERCTSGCTNVALAQMLYYYATEMDSYFTIDLTEGDAFVSGEKKITIDGSASNGTLSFAEINEMLEEFDATSAEEIAALCYASGVIAKSSFGVDQTSTRGVGVDLFLRAGFKSVTSAYKADPNSVFWDENGKLLDCGWQMLKDNIAAGRPVCTAMENPAHVVVIDGYDEVTDKIHINYGWGINGGKRYYSEYLLNEGSGWYSRAECDLLALNGFMYDITPDTLCPEATGAVGVNYQRKDGYAELSLDFTDDVGVWKKYYRTSEESEWIEYEDSVRVDSSATVQFMARDRAKNESAITDYTVSLKPEILSVSSSGVSWEKIADVTSYAFELALGSDFSKVIKFFLSTSSLNFFGMAGDWHWRVGFGDTTEKAEGDEILHGEQSETVQVFAPIKDGEMDVFFANARGKWSAKHKAQHLGFQDGWGGTKELAVLDGKNKLADIFKGSDDANILLMTDDGNGDALFVDDIYSAWPGSVSEDQARIAKIDEIRAGDGHDIVDMTSQQFAYTGSGVKIYGGLGNDTIWANNGSNTLFGDAEDDRLVGGSGDDVIVGGSGNDSMHGGGGEDIFTFGSNWGNDTVEQLEGGSVTLWFEDGSESFWDASTLTYNAGANSVKVSGVSKDDITLIFGDDGTPRYDELVSAGAFLDAASEKIFEDKDKGMLA